MAKAYTTGDVHVEDVKPVTAEGVITGLNVMVNYATLDAAGEQVTRSRETKDMYENLSGTEKTALQGIYVTLSTAVKAEYE